MYGVSPDACDPLMPTFTDGYKLRELARRGIGLTILGLAYALCPDVVLSFIHQTDRPWCLTLFDL